MFERLCFASLVYQYWTLRSQLRAIPVSKSGLPSHGLYQGQYSGESRYGGQKTNHQYEYFFLVKISVQYTKQTNHGELLKNHCFFFYRVGSSKIIYLTVCESKGDQLFFKWFVIILKIFLAQASIFNIIKQHHNFFKDHQTSREGGVKVFFVNPHLFTLILFKIQGDTSTFSMLVQFLLLVSF